MVPLLRKTLVCFYCGSRSKQKQDGTVRQWLCKTCDAVNYLDENGEITDHVPPSPIVKVRYADTQPVSTKPLAFSPTDSRPFCATCLKNQHLLTQALAAYLPAPTDPNYPAYEASYPEYRQKLEERYPQVCSKCEEGVAKQIRQAEYMANTEYLRRKIETTRNGARRMLAQRWGWRQIVILAGGVNWRSSLMFQVLWHIHAAKAQQLAGPGWRAEPFLWSCFALKNHPGCAPFTAYLSRIGLTQAVLSIWWNNQLWRKASGTGARLVGLGDYYTLQLVILLVRAGAWWASQNDSFTGLSQETLRAGHVFMVAFLILLSHACGVTMKLKSQKSTVISLRMVKVSLEPRLSFRRNVERPVSRPEKKSRVIPPAPAPIYPTPPSSQATSLAPLPLSPPHPGSPPSPPAEDFDEMDWTPSQEAKLFNPALSPITTVSIANPPQSPSPFYGRLPAQPISPAARLRNPPNRPHLRKIPDDKKEALVNNMRGYSSSDNEDGSDRKGKKHSIAMANPRFFPNDEYSRDTGLESLFDTVFTLGDPPEVAKAMKNQQARTARQKGPITSIKPAKLWKEWLVPAFLAIPVIVGLHWAIVGVWGIANRVIGAGEP
ncbi:MAG: hypothetical protein M1839_004478 [Geoglossum umbratile]|nr:MAG: hypothetical protein M1839_004478 [Geoglossum umbratile]